MIRTHKYRKNTDNTIEGKEPSYLIPLNDMLFLVKHIYNPKQILEYFIAKRHI
jgi:hypothetical protein